MSSTVVDKEKKLAALREMIQNAALGEASGKEDDAPEKKDDPPGKETGPSSEPFKKAMAAAVRLLSARDHGEYELKQKLKARRFGAGEIAEVLEECGRLGYIDDAQCCDRYYDELTAKGYGSRRVRSTMRDKGFAEGVIDEVFSLRQEETDELEIARRALRKKIATFKRAANDGKRKEKMYRFLHSRGFSSDVILEAIRESGLVSSDDFF